MVTLLVGLATASEIEQYVGIVLMVLECLLILIKFLQYLIPADSKFGQFLAKLFRGLKFLKKTAKDKGLKDDDKSDDPHDKIE